MTRLALIGTIGLVIISAILGLIYAISQQDVDEQATPPAVAGPASTDAPAANAQPAATPAPAAQPTADATPAPVVAPNPSAQTQVAAAAKIITPSFDVVRVKTGRTSLGPRFGSRRRAASRSRSPQRCPWPPSGDLGWRHRRCQQRDDNDLLSRRRTATGAVDRPP